MVSSREPELLLYFSPIAVESMFTFIDNVAERTEEQKGKDNPPFEAQGEETGDARDSLSLMRNGFTTERGLGELRWVKARNYWCG